jgi:hypothetical protein
VLKGPAEERVHLIAAGVRGEMCVGIEAVKGAEPGVGQIAEDVLGDQGWPQQQNRVRGEDRGRDRPARQRPDAEQDQCVATADRKRQTLE